MLLIQLNQNILQQISETESSITLGLLPILESQQQKCIEEVIEYCQGDHKRLLRLLGALSPASTAYAIAATASKSVTQGKSFWEPVQGALKINLSDPKHREALSQQYKKTCIALGVMTPDVSVMSWTHIAPIMAQASILHSWTSALATGIQSIVKDRPLPDSSDPLALQQFANELAGRIHNQKNLRNILLTEVGGMVAHRLIESCIYDRFDLLPVHLQTPIRKALEGSSSQTSLRSPYCTFSVDLGEFELVLPKQSGRLTTAQTHWFICGRQYGTYSEHRISGQELSKEVIEIELRNLGKGFASQKFSVEMTLAKGIRVFEKSTGKERLVRVGETNALQPGSYVVVMSPDCETNDHEGETQAGEFRLLENLLLRPGSEALIVRRDLIETTLSTSLRAGIFPSSDTALSTETSDGLRLHYGQEFGLTVYIPKAQHNGTLSLSIRRGSHELYFESETLEEETIGAFSHSEQLEKAIQNAATELDPGVHLLSINLRTDLISISRKLWFWKGLQRISQANGFICSESPSNIDYKKSKGIKPEESGCHFVKSYRAPRIRVATTGNEVSSFDLIRPGIRSICIDRNDGWEEDLKMGDLLTVNKDDKRLISFESGGFESWSLRCNTTEFLNLDHRRTQTSIGLHSLVSAFGNTGRIEAVNQAGDNIVLFRFASDLVGEKIEVQEDHGKNLIVWKTTIPLDEIERIGIRVKDYSHSPSSTDRQVTTLYPAPIPEEDPDFQDIELQEGIRLRTTRLAPSEKKPERLKIRLDISPPHLEGKLLLAELFRGSLNNDEWQSLRCQDFPTTSEMTITHVSESRISDPECSWWRHLWRTSKEQFNVNDLQKYSNIDGAEIGKALATISKLTTIKYPSAVYHYSAKFLSSMAHKLAERREGNGHRDINEWWQAGSQELEEHSQAKLTPVVRQFLLSCNPNILRRFSVDSSDCSETAEGLIITSLNICSNVAKEGGKVSYTSSCYHQGTHPTELFQAFQNFSRVLGGHETELLDFNFKNFFSPICGRVQNHLDGDTMLESPPCLSARHLLSAIEALNRRVRILSRASAGEADHRLAGTLQSLARTEQKLGSHFSQINRAINFEAGISSDRGSYDHVQKNEFPPLPGLNTPESQRIANLTWALCAVARGTAHGRISTDQFHRYLPAFGGENANRSAINILLSFAPELFAYYVGLLDFALSNTTQIAKP